jgi:iron complex outermembrane receptor protein
MHGEHGMSMRQRPLSIALHRLLLGASTLLLCGPSLAIAADPAPQDAATSSTATTPDQAPASKAKAAEAKLLGNVTVTAQSRSQEMQSVPIPLQIITAKQVETLAATDISKMDIFVPGLVVDAGQPTQPSYELRGIGGSGFGAGTESAVGVYVDGVYAARTGGSLLAFNDIERIEVLKGPQGTLFGRNSAAGAISIITNKPSDKLEAEATLRYGAYGERYEDALVNIPLNNNMALRVSVLDNQSDGWVKDAASGKHYGGNDDWGTRAQYRWNITPDTHVLLAWDHEQLKQAPQPAFGIVPKSSYVSLPAPLTGMVPSFPANPSTYLDPLQVPLYNDAIGAAETRRFDGVTLTIDHSFAWGGFTSTTAWRNFDTFNLGDYDGTNNYNTYLDTANIEHNNSWYQELKLSGNTDLIDWVAGTSFYLEKSQQTSQVDINTNSLTTLILNNFASQVGQSVVDSLVSGMSELPALQGDPWREEILNSQTITSYAAYGDVIWHFTDNLNLTTGVRFTLDQKQYSWLIPPRYAPQLDATLATLPPSNNAIFESLVLPEYEQNVIFTPSTAGPIGVFTQKTDNWRNVSPRAVLDYHFTPDVMVYGSVTRGYEAGGFNFQQVGGTYAPEDVTNYEVGVKSVFPDQHLLFNLTGYYYDYTNLQGLTLQPAAAGTNGIPEYVISTSDQRAYGLEAELQWIPFAGLQLGLNGAFIDSTYTHYIDSSGQNLDGQPTGTPYFSGAATLSYALPQVFNGQLVYDASFGYRGISRCNSGSGFQGTCQVSPSFTVSGVRRNVDMRLDWNAPGGHWGIGVFVTNLLNNRYVTGVDNITAPLGLAYANITPPRMWGVELRVKL